MGLIAAGYAVTTAGSARAALEAIAGEMPDVLVVDWLMPEMRGDELLELIRDDRETRGLRVMFLSNYPRDDPNVAGAVVAGEAIPWLTKSRTTPGTWPSRSADRSNWKRRLRRNRAQPDQYRNEAVVM